MTTKSQKLSMLKQITELKSEISRAKLSVHRTEIEGIESAIAEVSENLFADPPETVLEAASAAHYAGWAAQRRATLRGELAMAMARAQPVKESAAKDEARAQVVKRLIKRLSRPMQS